MNNLFGIKFKLYQWAITIRGGLIHLEGFILPVDASPSVPQLYRTSAITEVLTPHTVRTSTGSVYRLMGSLSESATLAANVPLWLARHFDKGFPQNWQKLLAKYVVDKQLVSVEIHDPFNKNTPCTILQCSQEINMNNSLDKQDNLSRATENGACKKNNLLTKSLLSLEADATMLITSAPDACISSTSKQVNSSVLQDDNINIESSVSIPTSCSTIEYSTAGNTGINSRESQNSASSVIDVGNGSIDKSVSSLQIDPSVKATTPVIGIQRCWIESMRKTYDDVVSTPPGRPHGRKSLGRSMLVRRRMNLDERAIPDDMLELTFSTKHFQAMQDQIPCLKTNHTNLSRNALQTEIDCTMSLSNDKMLNQEITRNISSQVKHDIVCDTDIQNQSKNNAIANVSKYSPIQLQHHLTSDEPLVLFNKSPLCGASEDYSDGNNQCNSRTPLKRTSETCIQEKSRKRKRCGNKSNDSTQADSVKYSLTCKSNDSVGLAVQKANTSITPMTNAIADTHYSPMKLRHRVSSTQSEQPMHLESLPLEPLHNKQPESPSLQLKTYMNKATTLASLTLTHKSDCSKSDNQIEATCMHSKNLPPVNTKVRKSKKPAKQLRKCNIKTVASIKVIPQDVKSSQPLAKPQHHIDSMVVIENNRIPRERKRKAHHRSKSSNDACDTLKHCSNTRSSSIGESKPTTTNFSPKRSLRPRVAHIQTKKQYGKSIVLETSVKVKSCNIKLSKASAHQRNQLVAKAKPATLSQKHKVESNKSENKLVDGCVNSNYSLTGKTKQKKSARLKRKSNQRNVKRTSVVVSNDVKSSDLDVLAAIGNNSTSLKGVGRRCVGTLPAVTAKRGTIKHRRQIGSLMIAVNHATVEQDMFAVELPKLELHDKCTVMDEASCAPFTPNTKPLPRFDESLATPAWFKTPTAPMVGKSTNNVITPSYLKSRLPDTIPQSQVDTADIIAVEMQKEKRKHRKRDLHDPNVMAKTKRKQQTKLFPKHIFKLDEKEQDSFSDYGDYFSSSD